MNGWLIADSDMHVMEPGNLWQRYMDPKWGLLTPIGLEDSDRDMRVKLNNVIQPQRGAVATSGNPYNPVQEAALRQSEERGWDARSQVLAMETESLDSTVLFPSRGPLRDFTSEQSPCWTEGTRAGSRHGHRRRLQRLDDRFRDRV